MGDAIMASENLNSNKGVIVDGDVYLTVLRRSFVRAGTPTTPVQTGFFLGRRPTGRLYMQRSDCGDSGRALADGLRKKIHGLRVRGLFCFVCRLRLLDHHLAAIVDIEARECWTGIEGTAVDSVPSAGGRVPTVIRSVG